MEIAQLFHLHTFHRHTKLYPQKYGTTTESGNVIVTSTGNLTINGATINLEGDSEFSVEIGGVLTFNNGVIQ